MVYVVVLVRERMREKEGRFHCLKCGRKHNRSSDIGSFFHYGLDVEREGFEPEEAAVGVAFVEASKDRRRPDATIDEIESEFERFGFDEQFPALNVESMIREWKDQGLIGDVRHSGKHWFLFLANRRKIGNERSPASLHNWMKNYANELERAKVR